MNPQGLSYQSYEHPSSRPDAGVAGPMASKGKEVQSFHQLTHSQSLTHDNGRAERPAGNWNITFGVRTCDTLASVFCC
jgi:hypothetical protein